MKRIILCFLLISLNIFAFKINNIAFDQQIDGQGYMEYKVYNDSLVKSRYKIKITSPNYEKENMSSLITVYPQILTIEPESYAVLKLFGNSKKRLENREYHFDLQFTPIIVPTIIKNKDNKTVSGSSSLKLSPVIEMSGYGGKINWSQCLFVKSLNLKKNPNGNGLIGNITVENKSYSGIFLGLKFYDKYKNKFDSCAIGRIPKKSIKTIPIEIKNFNDSKEIKKVVFYTNSGGDLAEVSI